MGMLLNIGGNDKFTYRTSDYDEDAGTGFQRHTAPYVLICLPDLRCLQPEWDSIFQTTWLVSRGYLSSPSSSLNFKVGTDFTCQTADYDGWEVDTSRTLAHIAVEGSPSSVSLRPCPRILLVSGR